jgi:acrylyl-CoA reductase (NADPH)
VHRFFAIRAGSDLIVRGLAQLAEMDVVELMAGDVEVAVTFSAVGRSDAEAACGTAQTSVPVGLVLGADLAGIVVRSSDARWRAGDAVIATGHGLGLTHHGGWAELARVPGSWLLRQPDGLTPIQCMAIGSPGLAAMQAVLTLDGNGVLPETGPVVVTGSTGGVGSLVTIALSAHGFKVLAVTRRPEHAAYLSSLGASDLMRPENLLSTAEVIPDRWAAAVDCLGGRALTALIEGTVRGGSVVSLGEVACERAVSSLAPFTHRGVSLLGVDMRHAARSRRIETWDQWAECVGPRLTLATTVINLEDAVPAAQALLADRLRGRVVIQVDNSRTLRPTLH